ncbi:hypothetical protein MYAM1_001489 [Malassezia yamatoensis]|uniref:MoaB/Mog domain-containing protein n=1 Tax=Malassezia yamatoensis TaxID=253288 RepID=A0AAJ6CFY1_9BASI|nr:hypothetical protein MYAM1_001489 [Malassezia yamatoensis]
MSSNSSAPPVFEPTPIDSVKANGPVVRTAACLIIGDEVLNGKTLDTNSNKLAKLCFELGIELKKTEVIPDEEDTIAESAQRLSEKYDWVVTSGGIGPTPDDMTYASLAKAFGDQPLEHDQETIRRMQISNAYRMGISAASVPEEVIRARHRMALFPRNAEVIFPAKEFWVPVVRMNRNVCILPGVPRIFEGLLLAYQSYLNLDPTTRRPIRCLIQVSQPESALSPLLERLTHEGKQEEIRVGSYPKWNAGVHISLIGYDQETINKYAEQVIKETGGHKL